MRWKANDPWAWKPTFAFLPVKIGEEEVWLEWYERRFCGDHYEVRALASNTEEE